MQPTYAGQPSTEGTSCVFPSALRALQRLKDLAKRDGISVNQFIASTAAEKVASFLTVEHLEREAAKGSRKDFEKFLRNVPNVPAMPRNGVK